jgi:hypothetical protein
LSSVIDCFGPRELIFVGGGSGQPVDDELAGILKRYETLDGRRKKKWTEAVWVNERIEEKGRAAVGPTVRYG